jgi:hypothetical protein
MATSENVVDKAKGNGGQAIMTGISSTGSIASVASRSVVEVYNQAY